MTAQVPRDAAATRARLLDAASAEFARHGLAGARVDRIAHAARANKQLIYAYFGGKEALFDAVVVQRLGVLADAVPFTPDDLPGYAEALLDHLAAHSDLVRLTLWKQLERPETTAEESDAYAAKVDALRGRPRRGGALDDAAPVDVLTLVLAAAVSGSLAPPALTGLADDGGVENRRTAHRAAVVAAVRAMTG